MLGAGQQGGINPQTGQPYQQFGAGGAQPNVPAARSGFQQRLQQIVSRAASGGEVQLLGEARIVPDERSNSLIVYASKEDMKMITNLVSKVDVLLAQVLIEAIVVQVDLGDTFEAGISATANRHDSGKFTGAGSSLNPGAFGGSSAPASSILDPRNLLNAGNFAGVTGTNGAATGAAPGGFSYYGRFGGNLDVALNLIATDNRANIVQRPRIQTSHAVPGSFFIGKLVPYASSLYQNYGYNTGAGYGTTASVQQIQVGTDLEVTPFITPD